MRTVRISMRVLLTEMVITSTLMAMPIMVPFYHTIGMDQGQIGLSQSLFTLVVLALNIPTGWIADRFSRKWSNAAGDLGCGLAIAWYSQAQSFGDVVAAEIIFGVAAAFAQGADSALLRAYSQRLDSSSSLFGRQNALLATWQPIAQIIALVIGGAIGATDLRLAIGMSAIPYVAGCALSFFLKEEGERLIASHRNPLRDMVHVTQSCVAHDALLRWLIIGYATGREVTHVMVWALTPLLIVAGVPLQIVAVGWILNALAVTVGAHIAHRWSAACESWQKIVLPLTAVVISLGVMSIHLSLVTIWLYAVLGLAQGWTAATLLTMVQTRAGASHQATIVSIAKSAAQLLYIPLVWGIGSIGTIDIRLTMVATIVVFAPLGIVTALRLRTLESR